MAQRTRRNTGTKAAGNRGSRSRSNRRRQEYQEDPGWGTAFQREGNSPPQPQFTGQGLLDDETLEAIKAAEGEFQVAIWTRGSDGKLLRNRDGTLRFRLHIEPPYDDSDDEDDDPEVPIDDEDLPF